MTRPWVGSVAAFSKEPADALAVEKPPPAGCSLASEADGSDFSFARQQIGVAATQAKERLELFAIAKFRDDEFRWQQIPSLKLVARFMRDCSSRLLKNWSFGRR